MSELTLVLGTNGKKGVLTFDEGPPTDGAVMSSDPSIATIELDADMVTWRSVPVALGDAVMSYTGTSVAPEQGPAVVPNMITHVVAAPVAEHGDFNPDQATDL